MKPAGMTKRIRVWDLPLRLFHWALLVCVVGAVVSIEVLDDATDWHARFGYAVATLLIFRIAWGFVGSRHARFLNFVRGPGHILAYLRGKKDADADLGHNPLGALSVLGLLLVLAIQAGTGLFLTDEILFEAPLFKHVSAATSELLGQVHEINSKLIFLLVGLHIAAILFYRFVKRENLVTPMITGNKVVASDSAAVSASGGAAALGLVIFALASALVWFVTTRL